MRFSPRMTDAEALMWQAERDPLLRTAFSSVTFLGHAPDIDGFRERMARAVRVIPRLGHRVVDVPAGLGPPLWTRADDFDLNYHVRHMALPAPGTRRQLLDLAATLHEEVFDPTGAGDSFAGGFMGYLARTNDLGEANLRRAMIYGSALGSFAVERFSVQRLLEVTHADIAKRVGEFRQLVAFEAEL